MEEGKGKMEKRPARTAVFEHGGLVNARQLPERRESLSRCPAVPLFQCPGETVESRRHDDRTKRARVQGGGASARQLPTSNYQLPRLHEYTAKRLNRGGTTARPQDEARAGGGGGASARQLPTSNYQLPRRTKRSPAVGVKRSNCDGTRHDGSTRSLAV